ncbi:formyltetrahydrofolate deformylase [Streptomyces oceani]|uniref:Formyltetrahydrofolate deformylase n=1 Tax=Streptomyces oceani TaxID=1075402 RepID=A0A1E7KMI2_9ACTN|nr:formyltetrahydrofolate deformylase [Streptomyces oceani]OEV05118.1 formyltetrahydrofolate deformylase [Streptomyces oceani]
MSQPEEYVLTLSCPDKPGIVHAVSSYLFTTGCNIEDSQQFGDRDTGLFFMRVHFSGGGPAAAADSSAKPAASQGGGGTLDKLRAGFAAIGDSFGMDWQLHRAGARMRVVLMVSRFGHCLNDLLFRSRTGALPVEIVAVVSNHPDFADLVASYGVPFRHIPVTRDTKAEAEAELLRLVRRDEVELVVLARYMQVLSDDLCKQLSGRIINIHHSFLPSFKGAKPYHQAHARGVKLIGATAHYVTSELDEGPIIEQEVERVGHEATPERLVEVGRDVECQALARAVKWHSEHRVLLNGHRTVVFS